MSSGEFSPTRDGIIRGHHADIVFQNDMNELSQYLAEAYGPDTLYKMPPEGLHHPVNYAALEFHKNDVDDISLFAVTSFDALVVRGNNLKKWQRYLSNKFKEMLLMNNRDIFDLPHMHHDFYVKLNDAIAAKVQFSADTHECTVLLSTEPLSELIDASEGKHKFVPDPTEIESPEHVALLRDFALLWSHAIDVITDELGDVEQENSGRPQIILAAPHRIEPEAEKEDADYPEATPVEQTEPAPNMPPDVEMYTSNELGLNYIGGLTSAKKRLREIANLFRDPVGSYMYGLSPQHFLLHGPPGTGKTSLVKALAAEIGASLEEVRSTDIVSKYVGESAQNIEKIFDTLKARPGNELIVLFFDEFEALARSGRMGTQERVDVKKLLNQEIDDISSHHKNIIIAAASNADIDDLEPSLIRPGRIEPIGAGNPNESERAEIWAAILTRSISSFGGLNDIEEISSNSFATPVFIPYSTDIDPVALAARSDGYNGAHFETMLTRARLKKFNLYTSTRELTVVTQSDLLEEIAHYGR